MILLVAFAFLAGIVTILSPCILPILPIILAQTDKSRPVGVIVGFIASFTFFTLFLSTIVSYFGIPADALRLTSIVIIAGFGISLLIPKVQLLIEQLFSKLANFLPRSNNRAGFIAGFLVGLSLGLLWTPCVGPILASVISLAITGTVTFHAFVITLAYSLGTAIPMFAIMVGGQNLLRKVPWLVANTANIQKVFGVIMILTAIGIYTNADRTFQTYILNKFPQYGAGLTALEDNELVRSELEKRDGTDMPQDQKGKPMFELLSPKGIVAPEIIAGGQWFNSDPLTLEQLKGKVVIIDFWTYSCINCQRTFPYLKAWWEKYKDDGLVIIGVHSPEFEFEKDAQNVAQALKDFGITYPVVQDNDFATWRNYNNRYWPAKYFVDQEGYIRYAHFGEGAYDESERVIQELLNVQDVVENPTYQNYSRTPETYLGYGRIANFYSNERITPDAYATYTVPDRLPNNGVAFEGSWKVTTEYAAPQTGAKLHLNFDAKDVFLVMRPTNGTGKVKVYVDDVEAGTITVDSDTLYTLVKLPTPGRRILRLEFEDGNVEVYAFTFG